LWTKINIYFKKLFHNLIGAQMTQKDNILTESLLQLARIALTGREQDIQLVVHRASKKIKITHPDLSEELVKLLQEAPNRATPLRRQVDTPLPVDVDSRLHLLRMESTDIEHDLILSEGLKAALNQAISERLNSKILMDLGLHPTKSLLFTGPPGIGKTMAAKWIANQLNKPLLVLDLAAVMSSYLGRTGNNIRFVLEYAKKIDCILLIDELDAIAKRRDDTGEIGELKRLVTVLLQEIDDWPSSGILIAATNHPDLLDPAVWRRFELVLKFENPSSSQIGELVTVLLGRYTSNIDQWNQILPFLLGGQSFSEIERQIQNIRKIAAIQNKPLEDLLAEMLNDVKKLPKEQKINIAGALINNGISQRQASELTGISRDTLRKHRNS